ncbi:MAG: zinc protease [Paracoccaceae bacterium]|jgi:zinc protease
MNRPMHHHTPLPYTNRARANVRAAARPGPAGMIRAAWFGIGLGLAAAGAFALASQAHAAADVQQITTPGGLNAWLVEEHGIPMVAIEIIFEGGATRDPGDLPGAAHFMASMLDEGAGGLDSAGFSDAADRLALRYGFDAGRDSFSVSARMLTEYRAASVDLLRTALMEPLFDAEPMERVRAQILSGLASEQTDPGDMADKAWRAALFPTDPYGLPVNGTAETIAKMTVADLAAARARALNRSRVSIGVVGDITAAELGPMLDHLLGALPDASWTSAPMATTDFNGAMQVVDFDTPQAVARLIGPGLLRDDPDFMPAYVMNHILGGGGFSSRLTTEVREKRGLTYSVWSYLAPSDRAGLIMAGVASDNATIKQAVDVIRDQWALMADKGVTAQELEDAQRYLTGAYPLRFDSNGKIAGQLAGLMRDGFTPAYLTERNDLINAVTLDDIARVAKRVLRPELLHVVVVGKPEGLATN